MEGSHRARCRACWTRWVHAGSPSPPGRIGGLAAAGHRPHGRRHHQRDTAAATEGSVSVYYHHCASLGLKSSARGSAAAAPLEAAVVGPWGVRQRHQDALPSLPPAAAEQDTAPCSVCSASCSSGCRRRRCVGPGARGPVHGDASAQVPRHVHREEAGTASGGGDSHLATCLSPSGNQLPLLLRPERPAGVPPAAN